MINRGQRTNGPGLANEELPRTHLTDPGQTPNPTVLKATMLAGGRGYKEDLPPAGGASKALHYTPWCKILLIISPDLCVVQGT